MSFHSIPGARADCPAIHRDYPGVHMVVFW